MLEVGGQWSHKRNSRIWLKEQKWSWSWLLCIFIHYHNIYTKSCGGVTTPLVTPELPTVVREPLIDLMTMLSLKSTSPTCTWLIQITHSPEIRRVNNLNNMVTCWFAYTTILVCNLNISFTIKVNNLKHSNLRVCLYNYSCMYSTY